MDKNELITLYLSQKLDSKSKKEFDYLMKTDTEFSNEVTFQKNLKKVIKIEEREIVKKQLQNFENKEVTSTNYKKLFAAASIIILLGLSSFWFLNSDSTINSQDLYAQNFEPYRNVIKPIVRGESNNDIESETFAAYESKDYNKALILFNKILEENDSEIINFYKANTLLQLNKTSEAITIFKQNTNLKDDWKVKNSWYLALAYLKADDIENAKEQLEELANNQNNSFKKNAIKELLKALN